MVTSIAADWLTLIPRALLGDGKGSWTKPTSIGDVSGKVLKDLQLLMRQIVVEADTGSDGNAELIKARSSAVKSGPGHGQSFSGGPNGCWWTPVKSSATSKLSLAVITFSFRFTWRIWVHSP
jgi:hypothetical protein